MSKLEKPEKQKNKTAPAVEAGAAVFPVCVLCRSLVI
jgi:galactose-1-phosphate uridylyltransferase